MRRAVVGIATIVAATATADARGTCVVSGKKTTPFVIEVAPREATPFKLRVEGMAVEAAPGGLETPAQVKVKGALAFEARAGAADLPARTKRAGEALNGMVRFAPDVGGFTLHANVRARLVDASVKLPGGVELRGLQIPCDALTLDDVPEPKPQLLEDNLPRWVATGKLLHFRTGPGSGPTMEAALDDESSLELKRLEVSGDWMRVTSRWPDDTMIHGWVHKDEVRPETTRHEALGSSLFGRDAGCTQGPTTRENERIVKATVAPGTQVYAARYLGPWAQVVDGGALQVRVRPKDDWVEIVFAPGIASVGDCVNSTVLLDAWIPRSAAKLPAELSATVAPVDGGAR